MSEEYEMPPDIKNDIKLAFDLYKNENNKINKLKLRTILFSFVFYKFSASDINNFIETRELKEKELFTFEDVYNLINEKLRESKERDSDELFNYIVNNKNESSTLKKSDLKNAFEKYEIDVGDEEIDKMLEYMTKDENNKQDEGNNNEETGKEKDDDSKKNIKVTREQFKKFFTDEK